MTHIVTVGDVLAGPGQSWQIWAWCPEHNVHYYLNNVIAKQYRPEVQIGCPYCMKKQDDGIRTAKAYYDEWQRDRSTARSYDEFRAEAGLTT